MAGSSYLLKSAASRRAAIQNEKNRIVDMEWNLSAKTSDDLALYQGHYEKASSTASSSAKISITSKMISATRSYTSKEIQRQTIGVLEGRSNNESKMNVMIGFYNSAVANDDLNLAQTLNLQIDSLYNTIVADQVKQLNTAQRMVESGYKNTKEYVAGLKSGDAKTIEIGGDYYSLNDMNRQYQQLGPDGLASVLDAAGKSYTDLINEYAKSVEQGLSVSAQNLTGADQMSVVNDIYDFQAGTMKFNIPGLKGDMGVTVDEIRRAVESQVNGTSPFTPSQNSANGKPGFSRAKITTWGVTIGDDGRPTVSPIYQQAQVGQDKMTTNLPVTDIKGNTEVKITDSSGRPASSAKTFRAANGDIVDEKGKVVIKAKQVPILEQNGAVIKPVNMTPAETLQAKGFTVYDNGTVDFPVDSTYGALSGAKNTAYNVDNNGLLQFTHELPTNNPKQPIQRNSYIYDAKTNLFTNAMEKGNYTINNKTFNRMGELIGTGGPGQNVNPAPKSNQPGTFTYDESYARQRQITPSLPADPYKGSYTINGTTYNAAGDVISGVSRPVPAPVAAKPAIVQPSNIGKQAASAIVPKPAATPFKNTSSGPIILENKLSF